MAWTGIEEASQCLGRPGQDLVMIGYMALSGTDAMVRWDQSQLEQRLPVELLAHVKELEQQASQQTWMQDETQLASMEIQAWYPVGVGGVFNALWYMADHWGTGFCVQMKELPVRQETIEICELEEKNPYYLWSAHCLLVAADHGHRLCETMKTQGVPARVIGVLTDNKDKVLVHGSTVSCLNRPKEDELDLFMRERGLDLFSEEE